MGWLGREHLREQLQFAQAHRMADANKDDYSNWQRDLLYTVMPQEGA